MKIGVATNMYEKSKQEKLKEPDSQFDLDNEMLTRFFDQTIETFIKPEIERRRKNGKIHEDFVLEFFQVIMNMGQQNEVRLNEEVKIVADVQVNKSVEVGDSIRRKDIESFHDFHLTKDDENAGHITGILIDGTCILSFNCQYNTQKRQEILNNAEEFLQAAESSLGNGNYRAFHENLFTAVEAAVIATLTFMPDENLFSITKHGTWKSKINLWRKRGNINADYVDLYNSLFDNRNKARYTNKPFVLGQETSERMLKLATEFIFELRDKLPKVVGL